MFVSIAHCGEFVNAIKLFLVSFLGEAMFYDNLKEVCREKGTTVTTVLKDLKMSTGSTGKWRDGSIPKIDTVMQLSEHLGVSLDRLVYGRDDVDLTEIDPEWIEIISHIPENKQQMCKDFLRTHMVVPDKYEDRKRG